MQCAMSLSYFTLDQSGFPTIAPDWKKVFDDTREQMMLADPVILPHLAPPPEWTQWRAKYENRIGANFVRDWRPETREAITEAFAQPDFEHARGVNHLQRVALKLDTVMVDLAEWFAVELMGHGGEQREKDELLVINDIAQARALRGNPFWLTYNCDRRGRVYGIPHFNYGREDHVRAMIRFKNGMPLGKDSLQWLEINCANCAGKDKEAFPDRIKWARDRDNRKEIEAVAADPFNTWNLWHDKDEPLRYVSACRELAAAWQNPETFVTNLPIAFRR